MKLCVIITIAGRHIQQVGSLDVAGKPIPAMVYFYMEDYLWKLMLFQSWEI